MLDPCIVAGGDAVDVHLTGEHKQPVKLEERIDELELQLAEVTGKKVMSAEDFSNITLTPKEKEIFLILYSQSGDLFTLKTLSKALGFTEQMVRRHITNITDKGIPIVRKYFDNTVYLVLDPDFRNLQAKENIVQLN